jgi:hypothetical protein
MKGWPFAVYTYAIPWRFLTDEYPTCWNNNCRNDHSSRLNRRQTLSRLLCRWPMSCYHVWNFRNNSLDSTPIAFNNDKIKVH